MTTLYMPLDQSTRVYVCRTVKAFGTTEKHGPMTIADAFEQGLMSKSHNTVATRLEVAEGEYRGRDVTLDKNQPFVRLPAATTDDDRAVARGAVFYMPSEAARTAIRRR